VVVAEVGGEGVDEQHLLAGFRVGAHHRVLGVRVLGLERQAFSIGMAAPKLASMLWRARRSAIFTTSSGRLS
jgi:hypothetical protein